MKRSESMMTKDDAKLGKTSKTRFRGWLSDCRNKKFHVGELFLSRWLRLLASRAAARRHFDSRVTAVDTHHVLRLRACSRRSSRRDRIPPRARASRPPRRRSPPIDPMRRRR